MSRFIKKHVNIIALTVVAGLIIGQDIYIFSILGPSFDLLKGPEGIREAQQFSNSRSAATTVITHGLLIALIVIVIAKPANIYIPGPEGEANNAK